MKIAKRMIALAGAATLAGAPASAACWSTGVIEAAVVKEFDAVLMDHTLRCRAQGVDMTAAYNRFARGKQAILAHAADTLRTHFAQGSSNEAAYADYDRFTAKLVVRDAAIDCVDFQQLVTIASAIAPDTDALLELAVRAGASRSLPVETCRAQFARAD